MSGPMPPWPFGAITPMTLNGWLRMRMIWPIESASAPNSVSLTVLPSTATLVALVTSCALKNEPMLRRPRADQREVDVGALNAGEPVLVAGDHLRLRLLSGGHVLRARDLPRERACASSSVRVLEVPDATAHAARGEVAGVHRDHVGPGALDLVFDHRLCAVAHGDERDDRRNADDHPEHGQSRAHLVATERLERDAERHYWRHRAALSADR